VGVGAVRSLRGNDDQIRLTADESLALAAALTKAAEDIRGNRTETPPV
jgi:hypothetical protein